MRELNRESRFASLHGVSYALVLRNVAHPVLKRTIEARLESEEEEKRDRPQHAIPLGEISMIYPGRMLYRRRDVQLHGIRIWDAAKNPRKQRVVPEDLEWRWDMKELQQGERYLRLGSILLETALTQKATDDARFTINPELMPLFEDPENQDGFFNQLVKRIGCDISPYQIGLTDRLQSVFTTTTVGEVRAKLAEDPKLR
jgi:hypothetical protein